MIIVLPSGFVYPKMRYNPHIELHIHVPLWNPRPRGLYYYSIHEQCPKRPNVVCYFHVVTLITTTWYSPWHSLQCSGSHVPHGTDASQRIITGFFESLLILYLCMIHSYARKIHGQSPDIYNYESNAWLYTLWGKDGACDTIKHRTRDLMHCSPLEWSPT